MKEILIPSLVISFVSFTTLPSLYPFTMFPSPYLFMMFIVPSPCPPHCVPFTILPLLNCLSLHSFICIFPSYMLSILCSPSSIFLILCSSFYMLLPTHLPLYFPFQFLKKKSHNMLFSSSPYQTLIK